MFVCKVKIHMLVPVYSLCVPSLCVRHRRMKHSAICSMKNPLKNTCAAALSSQDLLWSDEAKEKGQTYCLSTLLCSRAQKSNCVLRALHCGDWWCWSTETKRGKRKWRLLWCMWDCRDFSKCSHTWLMSSLLTNLKSYNVRLKKKKKDKL